LNEETFEGAGPAARDNAVFSPRRTEPGTFLLRRMVRCGRCGVKLACHRAQREHGLARYYLCPRHDPVRAGGEDRRCTERRIRADELDAFVYDQVRALLAQPDLLTAGEAAVAAQAPVPDDELLSTQLARLDRRAQATQAERRRLADLYQAGVIEAAELTAGRRAPSFRRQHLDDERQALITQRPRDRPQPPQPAHQACHTSDAGWTGSTSTAASSCCA
jgi:site-specific DNA recombinase